MAEKSDSLRHHEERAAKMRTEAEATARKDAQEEEQRKQHQAERDETIREEQRQELTKHAGLARDQMTRDMLLERIREMRNEKPVEYVPPPLSPEMQAQLEREQQAGREAVARAEENERRNREIAARAQALAEAEGEKNRQDGSGVPPKSRHG